LKLAESTAVIRSLRGAEHRYRELFDTIPEGIVQWTAGNKLLAVNEAFATMLGFDSAEEVRNAAPTVMFFCADATAAVHILAELDNRGTVTGYEFQLRKRESTSGWGRITARGVTGPDGRTAYYEACVQDITEYKDNQAHLAYLAYHDALTGLGNRAMFEKRLEMALRREKRGKEDSFAVIYLDLDRFKTVNDCHGHSTGDDVLCRVAATLRSCLRAEDTVARFGGDEFAMLIENVSRPSFVILVARRIHAALSVPMSVNGCEVVVGSSMGIVLRAERYAHSGDILRDADIAMYRSKIDPYNSFRFFNHSMRRVIMARAKMEMDLRTGIKYREFYFDFQPLVRLEDRNISGLEALLRWRRDGEIVYPDAFIPVAEETGLIKIIGRHMLELACRQMVDWERKYGKSIHVHINISGSQLESPHFVHEAQRMFERTGVNPCLLRFEITESVLLKNTKTIREGIAQLRALGVKFCLDDFGTGYSSLSYLRTLTIDCLKLDRSFMRDIDKDRRALAVVRNLIVLAQELGLLVVAEGVESASQAEMLITVGCGFAQGFHYYRPLPVVETEELLAPAP
jgi:diguanylate cyclase (GGDEF)-like protein/PAS domain S-box-containing protein